MSFNYSKSSATFEKNLNIDSQNLDSYRYMCVSYIAITDRVRLANFAPELVVIEELFSRKPLSSIIVFCNLCIVLNRG